MYKGYAEVIADAVLTSARGEDVSTASDIPTFEASIKLYLEEYDWEKTGFKPVERRDPLQPDNLTEVTPAQIAKDFVTLALSDRRLLRQFAHTALNVVSPGLELSQEAAIVHRSHGLLSVANLPNPVKNDLFKYNIHPCASNASKRLKLNMSPEEAVLPIRLFYIGSEIKSVVWAPLLQRWIRRNITPESGCPATRILITNADGKRVTLLHYFWDVLAELDYPEPKPSAPRQSVAA